MADITSIYGNPIKDAVARADIVTNTQDISDLKDGLSDLETQITATLITDTASGAIASFPDGADGVPVKSLTVAIEPVQSGSGDPSPTNIRPISGHTQAVVTRTGVNVWDEEWVLGYFNNGVFVPSANHYVCSKNLIGVYPNAVYYFRIPSNVGGYYVLFYDANGTYLGYDDARYASTTITIRSDARYIAFQMAIQYGTTYNHDISINYPSTDHDYHAYNGQTYTIALGGTRYGGSLDVGTGVLTVDRAIVDLGTLTYTYDSASKRFGTQSNAIPIKPISGATVLSNMICSQYKTVKGQDQYDDITLDASISQGGGSSAIVRIRDTAYTDATAFKTAMNGVQLCYELATPFTVQLTAEDDITTLKGTNNIWNDCGNTEVEYRADTKLYINKVLNA